MPFISLLDNRAKPKGSRDPLGFELVWSHFGRKVVGNLTTITSSMDNFAIALLGFYWVNQIIPMDDSDGRHKKVREAFIKYEQLTGYIRYYGKAQDIMGITRIKKRLNDDSIKLTLGMTSVQQILSDQASYGLWGLYSTAARETGLVEGSERRMTHAGSVIAENIINQLGDDAKTIYSTLLSPKPLNKSKLKEVATSLMDAIHHESVQQPLLDALMSGRNSELQKELWRITQSIFNDKKSPDNVEEFIQHILDTKPSEELTRCIQDIMNVERLLVASNNIFHYCRSKNSDSLEAVISGIEQSFTHLASELPAGNFANKTSLQSILDAFKSHDMNRVIRELVQLNKDVMKQRNGAPWIEITSGKALDVKVKNEKGQLKKQIMLENKWDYDYFLGSYLSIARKHIG